MRDLIVLFAGHNETPCAVCGARADVRAADVAVCHACVIAAVRERVAARAPAPDAAGTYGKSPAASAVLARAAEIRRGRK